MLIASLTDLLPIDHTAAFPDTSFAENGPNDAFLIEHGYAKVNLFKPHDRKTEKLVSCQAYYEAPWVYTVIVEPKSQQELDADQEAQATEVRAKRNRLLAECDWTQGKDISDTISQPWAAYRQQLRDITLQPEFPWTVQWPSKP